MNTFLGDLKVSKTVYVKNLKAKDEVSEIFLVKYLAVMESRDGKSYLNVILADNSGDVEARKWSGANDVFSKIAKGDFVLVSGKVNIYQNRKQIIINKIEKVDRENVDSSNFIPKSDSEPEAMFEELVSIVENLEDIYIKDLLKSVLYDSEITERLKVWFAGKTIHHSYEGGLLEHILSCTKLAVSLSAHYKVNTSYVVAGCIMHDLCKVFELSSAPLVEYTDEGKLVGHLVKGAEFVEFYSSKIKGFPYSMKNHLKHIMLSHHGEYEYGSPKVPQTREAFLVHLIDLMDSKMGSLEQVIKTDKTPGKWSGFVKHLDRIIFKEDLPTFSSYINPETSNKNPKNLSQRPSIKRKNEKPLTHNMSKMLEGFKVSSDD